MIGQNIKRLRQERGWSQEELSLRIHVTRQTISKWEKGQSIPDADIILLLTQQFNCTSAELLGEYGNHHQKNEFEQVPHYRPVTFAQVLKTLGIFFMVTISVYILMVVMLAGVDFK